MRAERSTDSTTTLGGLLGSIGSLDPRLTIYASLDRPLSPLSPAFVADEGSPAAVRSGFGYLLEVFLAKEAIEVWSAWHRGRTPEPEDCVAAVAYYATHDAYLPDSPADPGPTLTD